MFKNVASTFIVFAWDTTTGVAKTGDAANITAYVKIDGGAVTVLGDTSATEMDATNAKGYYEFTAAQAETNGDRLVVTAKSATANIAVVGAPAVIPTRPTTGWLAPAVAGRTLAVDAAGRALSDLDTIKTNAIAMIAGRLDVSVGAISDDIITFAKFAQSYWDGLVSYVWSASVGSFGTVSDSFASAIAELWSRPVGGGTLTAAEVWSYVTRTVTAATNITSTGGTTVPQTGDNFARLGAPAGASISADIAAKATAAQAAAIQADTDDIQTRLPSALVGGRMLSHVEAVSNGVLSFASFTQNFWDGVTTYVWGASVGVFGTISDSFGSAIAELWSRPSSSGPTAAAIADAVWDEVLSEHLIAGTTGFALNAAGSAGDPWGTALPGAYGAGSAGFIIGTNLNTTVSSRLASASYTAPDNTTIGAIAGRIPAALIGGRMSSHVEDISDGVLTEPKFSTGFFDAIVSRVWGAGVGSFGTISDSFAGAVAEIWSRVTALLDVAISTRLASASYTAPDNATISALSLRLPTALINGRMASHVEVISDGLLTFSKFGQDYWNGISAYVWTVSVGSMAGVSDSYAQAVAEMWNKFDVPVSSRSSHAAADVWSVSVRLLTGGNNIVLAKGVGITGLNDPTAAENADAVWDEVVDGVVTGRESVRLVNSALGGKASGLEGTNPKYRDLADTKDRINATADANGNRTAVVRDLT